MQKKLMKNLLFIMTMVVLCFAVGVTASALEPTGQCGDDVYWNYNETTGELEISGEGDMWDYEWEKSPFYRSDIKSIIIENGVTDIGKNAFHYCTSLTTATISDSVTSIGYFAFYECANLKNVNMGNSIITIDDGAFDFCNSLEKVILPDSVTYVGRQAFQSCYKLTEVIIGNNVTFIGSAAFNHCTNLKNLVIGNKVSIIEEMAFCACYSLMDISLPDSVTYIGDTAFGYCESFTSIDIPDNVETIGNEAFIGCFNITRITLGKSVSSIGDYVFENCQSLKIIEVDKGNEFFSNDVNGVLFNKDKTVLIQYPIGKESTSYDIPDTVVQIRDWAFYTAYNLENIRIPKNVISVGVCAFSECLNLTSATISESVNSIGEAAFSVMPFLEKITIRSMDANLSDFALCANTFNVSGINKQEFIDLFKLCDRDDSFVTELEKYIDYAPNYTIVCIGTIYCHSGSTAEAYAIANGADYVLTHFFEDEWTYDYDNMIRFRKCIHCDELETELLETTTDSDVEIIEPTDPDTDFVVDVITDYVVIEEALENNVAGDFEIVKAFDITMTDKDGVQVQPDGTVKVKLPLDWSTDGVYKVYRVNDDGTLTDMNAYREGSHMVFDTDHFSIYVIVDESEKTAEPITPDEPQEETKDDFFLKIIDLIKSFFGLIASWFRK